MKRVLHVARTEMLEHRRQPWMLVILSINYLVIAALYAASVWALGTLEATPDVLALVAQQVEGLNAGNLETFLTSMRAGADSAFGALLFTNLPLFVAIMSGYSVLHDRTHGTLPFLMLAPLSRYQLLLGKLLGAIALPLALHFGFVGGTTLFIGVPEGALGAWIVSFVLGAPASAMLVGALGTVISALSRDVRTSMQFTSFFIGWLSLAFGFVLVNLVSEGVGLQLAFAFGCVTTAVVILFAGSRIVSRELAA